MAYLRFPHLNNDQLVFVADDDIWIVDAGGGRAERLTSDRAPAQRPRLSHDGAHVAWASRRAGNPDVYVAPVAGGPATRLTYGNHLRTRPLGWAADGRFIVATPAQHPFRSRSWAYALPVDGGAAERLPYGPINGLARHPGGAVVLMSTINRDPATWKRYRGGTAGKLWIDRDGSGEFEPFVAELDGQLSDPVWVGDRVVFLSDHEGHGNVYSVAADGSGLRRHSDFTGMYARDLAADLEGGSTSVVFHRSGVIYRLDSFDADSEPVEVAIELPGQRRSRQPAVAKVELSDPEQLDVDATARASAVEVRGTVQWLTHRDGPVRALSAAPGVRTRLPRVLPGAERAAVWVTDAEGDDALELSDGRRLAAGQLGRVLELVAAPDGKSVAVATHDGRLLQITLADGQLRELDHSDYGDVSGVVFSPDSAWLAYSKPHRAELRSIQLADLAAGTVHEATTERFHDTSPTFTPDGKYLAFLSARTFDPVYDAHNFELSFTTGVRPYVIPLAADTPSPFDPEAAGRAIGEEKPEGGADGKAAEATPVTVRVDLEGLTDRTVVAPVGVGLHTDLTAAKGGLLWLTHPVTGAVGSGRPTGAEPPRPTLWRWDLGARRAAPLVDKLDWFRVSGDGTRIVVRDGDALRVGPSDHPVKPSEDDGPSELVEVDLSRVQVHYDPPAEWRQMMTETWRLMRDHFWIEDMGGVDWDEVLERYLPLVDRLATRDDLSEVLWEMIGELGSSHAYENPVYPPSPEGEGAASLGADIEQDGAGRWVFARVLPSESSVPGARSPLRAAGANVADGDVLVAVNGRPLDHRGPAPLLAGLAGKPVELTVATDGSERIVVVVPTADEVLIRYHDWVSGRRAAVHEATEGKVGYVHVPDMMSTGWAEFNRDLRRELQRDALVLDTRDNNGGHVSQLIIERLSRRVIGGGYNRYADDEDYPSTSPRGPIVSLANQYSGSDGDIVNEAFREMGLGKIVGLRTWGGVIGIDGRYTLVDGTSVTQPRYSFWFRDAGWGVENYGVDPDIEVPFPPQAWVAGADPQLAEGLRVLRDEMRERPPLQPTPVSERPDRAAPPLPPRPQ